MSLVLGAISLPGCKNKEVEAAKASANQAHRDFKAQVGKLQAATSALRARFKALPEDLPGLEPINADLFAVEEVLGVEGARIEWLSGELNAAVSARDKDQIQKVTDLIRGAGEGGQGIEKRLVKVTQEIVPFETMAAERRAKPKD